MGPSVTTGSTSRRRAQRSRGPPRPRSPPQAPVPPDRRPRSRRAIGCTRPPRRRATASHGGRSWPWSPFSSSVRSPSGRGRRRNAVRETVLGPDERVVRAWERAVGGAPAQGSGAPPRGDTGRIRRPGCGGPRHRARTRCTRPTRGRPGRTGRAGLLHAPAVHADPGGPGPRAGLDDRGERTDRTAVAARAPHETPTRT